MFSYSDGATCSGKKDGIVNINNFLTINNKKLFGKAKEIVIDEQSKDFNVIKLNPVKNDTDLFTGG